MNNNLPGINLLAKSEPYGSGDSYLLTDALPINKSLFDKINSEIKWQEMRHQGGLVPREISIQGTIKIENGNKYEPIYRHPADEQPELIDWTPSVLKIKTQIEKLIEQEFNHALIQRYRNGKDYIGAHSDKTLDILKETNIVNYSLGATRIMILENKKDKEIKQKIQLPHNSVFVMGWKTNREWLHSIKQDRRMNKLKNPDELLFDGQRISLTFRTITTFRNTNTGLLFGQGARKTSIQVNSKVDERNLLQAFSAENKQGEEFDWNRYYGRGFNCLNFKRINHEVPLQKR